MNDNNQQIDSTVKKISDHKVSAKRRTLVKGTMGALPAVLTLRSGAAFALDSSEVCVPFDNAKAASASVSDNLDIIATTADIWVREPVYYREVLDVSDSSTFKVYHEDPMAEDNWRSEDYIMGVSGATYENADPFPAPGSELGMVVTGGDKTDPKFQYSATVPGYALAVMSETGSKTNVIGNAAANANGLPYITNSCWCSATPTA
ncbi:MAG: hypothetical protein KAJ63_05970 [Methyloprofundus sp.]|nr:hypothetical protein [Methyloprofundus sp.]